MINPTDTNSRIIGTMAVAPAPDLTKEAEKDFINATLAKMQSDSDGIDIILDLVKKDRLGNRVGVKPVYNALGVGRREELPAGTGATRVVGGGERARGVFILDVKGFGGGGAGEGGVNHLGPHNDVYDTPLQRVS